MQFLPITDYFGSSESQRRQPAEADGNQPSSSSFCQLREPA